jgi:hypothetical protein
MTGLPSEMRHTYAVSKDRAGSAPVATSAYFTDSSYVRTILQLVNKQMGLTLRGLPIPYNRNRTPARTRSPSSFDLSNALCNNPAWRKLLRGSPCLLSTANSQESVASQGIDSRNLTKCSTWHLECRKFEAISLAFCEYRMGRRFVECKEWATPQALACRMAMEFLQISRSHLTNASGG